LSPPTNIATRSPNASPIAAAVAGTGTASGTNTIARRPPSMHRRTASTATATSSSGAGRITNAPAPEESADTNAAPLRYDEESGDDVAEVPPPSRRAPAPHEPSSPATRGGTALPITAANGATYRSLTHRSRRSMSSSKKRTGDTTFFTLSIRVPNDSEDPSTHPRITRPWNGTCTSDPTPASSSGGNA
jgi:hypothetical protein